MGARKGQAALEFLTTYGWAFLVVLVMIGALAYFGVLDPSRFLPEKCVFGSGVGCLDYGGFKQGTGGNISARLVNGFGYGLSVTTVNVTWSGIENTVNIGSGQITAGMNSCNKVSNAYCGIPETWAADGIANFWLYTPNIRETDRPRLHVTIRYTKGGSAYVKEVEGDVQVRPIVI
ncbi:MAG: hypothetical protein ABIH41_03560 [Nanoarchaeota archaeon]